MKGFYKLRKTLGQYPDPRVCQHLFDHTVKPILLYSSEIWTFNAGSTTQRKLVSLEDYLLKLPQEKANARLCRYILGVHNRSSLAGTFGELGRLPLYIDNIIAMVKYWHRLKSMPGGLLNDTLAYYRSLPENSQSWLF
jgi:hypothetical protein